MARLVLKDKGTNIDGLVVFPDRIVGDTVFIKITKSKYQAILSMKETEFEKLQEDYKILKDRGGEWK